MRRVLGDILLEASPQNKEVYYPRAQVYFDWLTDEKNREEGADPDNAEWLLKKGLAHAGQKGTALGSAKDHYTLAQEAFEKASALDPENVEAPLALAMAMRAHKDPDIREPEEINKKADTLLDTMVDAHPSVKSHLARLRYRSTYGNPKGALEDARAAIKLEPDNVTAMIAAAILEFEEGQNVDEARALLRRAIEKQPEKLDAYAVLIELEKRYGRYAAAEEVAREGIRNVAKTDIDPVTELYWTLVNTLIEARESTKAEELIKYMRGRRSSPYPFWPISTAAC